jgi:hypothetical protein
LGGSFIERGVPRPAEAFPQLEQLIKMAGRPERVSLRFDPVVFWKEGRKIETNLHFFETLAPKAKNLGIKDIRFSFAQWYGKALRRASKHDFHFIDPSREDKKERARYLAQIAASFGLSLYACSQSFLDGVSRSFIHSKSLPRELKIKASAKSVSAQSPSTSGATLSLVLIAAFIVTPTPEYKSKGDCSQISPLFYLFLSCSGRIYPALFDKSNRYIVAKNHCGLKKSGNLLV